MRTRIRSRPTRSRSARSLGAGALLLAAALTLSACGGGASDEIGGGSATSAGSTQLSLVGYAAAEPAFAPVIDGFRRSSAGKDVSFATSYGPSGDQSRKVVAGLPTDVVSFSVEPDMTRLVKAGLVDKDWNQSAFRGVPFGSVVSLVVRKGNPKHIETWDDLLKPGVEVITPNPLSSGSAMWNLLAPYAAESDGGKNPQAGLDYIQKLVTDHVKSRPSSGRDATDLFLQGSGDVLISYENEAIFTQRAGKAVDYVDPAQNIRIENPFAVLDNSGHADAARDFENYLYSTDGQTLLAKAGFRPADPGVAAEYARQFPVPAKLWTVADLGGWDQVSSQLFDKDSGAITKIYTKAIG
ncbi:sulfate ABC transporter substrate-binding protein [Rhodococcus sp. D2-41]|uniref:Sulfate ABC transporter substrate-binding protein n=1 Tax=Speluncibacter jeojiensis TaxID=2710754 RepID=A0A9X4M2M5_9ACTN|nr:sulfate ABC transporter substrate-binding protein [Rhodococcus sp. D2-41]MDG3011824.1 sulfate ABC transporter substrate-binding protein [Rhodococcus sp. D2-41]MDG3013276.1 sulfate ABC transporter substrate-binding protein [Corynebacteriales bacterium D3-21]